MLAAAGALLWVLLSEPRGPLISGKPVAYWTRQLRAGHMDPVVIAVQGNSASYWTRRLHAGHMDPDVIGALASDKAVAVPALVRQLSLPDSRVKDAVKRLWRRLPAPLRARIPEPTTRGELRAGAAFALVMIWQNEFLPRSEPSLSEAQIMLPSLTKGLQDRNLWVRLNVAIALGHLGVISVQAIESCEVAMKDTDWSVRGNAVVSLGQLATTDARAIPHIKLALSDSHPGVRRRAAEQLRIAPSRDDASIATEAK